MDVAVLISVIIILCVIYALYCSIFDYFPFFVNRKKFYERNGKQTINFNMFVHLYGINPDKWVLYDISVRYLIDRCYPNDLYFDSNISLRRYRKWKRKHDNDAVLEKINAKTKELSESWIKDIEIYKKKSIEGENK